ncbi:LLM class flavin-dependent oxidoreductase [Lentzea alba]|uniref:LLM class flavin-dependent oxidoreductase n=1 Tax=Lentzea alba TaxID=2714351 RepID=UPI0039BF2345
MRLSVLDLSLVAHGGDVRSTYRDMIELARHVEELGYHRFWLTEHHNAPGFASAAPGVLIGRVAAATRRLRVGSGGVMLPNHSPLAIAEQYGTLEALFPGRIDLGVGRAHGADPKTAELLRGRPLTKEDTFAQEVAQLAGYFGPPRAGAVRVIAAEENVPPLWILGSSEASARLAAKLGVRYVFAHHFFPQKTAAAVALYRDLFEPSAALAAPHVMIPCPVIAAETDEQARWLAGPTLMGVALGDKRPELLPTPEQASAHAYDDAARVRMDNEYARMVAGSKDTVRAGLWSLVDAIRPDELMILTPLHGIKDRLRSYELVAELTIPALKWSQHDQARGRQDQATPDPCTLI